MAEIKPTMTDDNVMDFVANGYVVLDEMVDADFNERCRNLEQGPAKETVGSPDFIREVLLHPRLAGVIRSLLGPNFLMPTGGHHHLIDQPVSGQDWHSDGISGLGLRDQRTPVLLLPAGREHRGWSDHDPARFPLPGGQP